MKKVAALLVLALAAVALVACGRQRRQRPPPPRPKRRRKHQRRRGGGGKEAGGGRRRLDASNSKPTPAATSPTRPTSATAKAGKVTIDFNNPQALTHDVAIEDSSGKRSARPN